MLNNGNDDLRCVVRRKPLAPASPGEGRDPDRGVSPSAHSPSRPSLATTTPWVYGSRPSPGRR